MRKIRLLKLILISEICLFTSQGKAWENCDVDGANSTCEWQIEDGILIIKGTGENGVGRMPSYKYGSQVGGAWEPKNNIYSTNAPWFDYKNEITGVKVMEGIENIGGKAFMALDLTYAELPSTLKSIDEHALWRTKLTSIDIPEGVTFIGDRAFEQTPLENLVIPNTVTTIETRAFSQSWIFNRGVYSSDEKMKSLFIGDKVESLGEFVAEGVPAYVYCREGDGHGGKSCSELITEGGISADKLKIYTIDSNGKIKVGSKTYDSFDDLPKYVLRRIYTLKEAEEAAGKVNSVKIRYR